MSEPCPCVQLRCAPVPTDNAVRTDLFSNKCVTLTCPDGSGEVTRCARFGTVLFNASAAVIADVQATLDAAALSEATRLANEDLVCPPCINGSFQEVREDPDTIQAQKSYLIDIAYDPTTKQVFMGGKGHIVVFDGENPDTAPTTIELPDVEQFTEGLVYNPVDGLIWLAMEEGKLLTLDPSDFTLTEVYDFTGDGFICENFTHPMFMDASRNHLWLMGHIGGFGGSPSFVVFDCATLTILSQQNLVNPTPFSTSVQGCYCGSNDSVYLFERVTASSGNIYKVNAETMVKTLLPLGVIPQAATNAIWIAETNEVWFGAVISGSNYGWAVLDPQTDTIVFGPVGSLGVGVGSMAYNSTLDKVYFARVNDASESGYNGSGVVLINPTTHLAETNIILDSSEGFTVSTLFVPLRGGQVWTAFNGVVAGGGDPGVAYAFSNCIYENTEQCATAECAEGQTGEPVERCKDAGYATSLISQADANETAFLAAQQEAEEALECEGDVEPADPANWGCPVYEPLGGSNIPASRAANQPGAMYTFIGPIGLTECDVYEMDDSTPAATFILTAPSGWEFEPGQGAVEFAPGGNVTAVSINVTATEITLTVDVTGLDLMDQIIIRHIKVIPLTPASAPGYIVNSSSNPGTWFFQGAFGPSQDGTSYGQLNLAP